METPEDNSLSRADSHRPSEPEPDRHGPSHRADTHTADDSEPHRAGPSHAQEHEHLQTTNQPETTPPRRLGGPSEDEKATLLKLPSNSIMLNASGTTYMPWALSMGVILRLYPKIYDIYIEKTTRPEIPPNVTPTDDQKKAIAEFDKWNVIGQVAILNSMEPSIIMMLFQGNDMETKSILHMMREIKKYCTDRTGASNTSAYTNFSNFKFKKNRSMEENLEDFVSIQRLMELNGTEIPDQLIQAQFIAALPRDWSSFASSYDPTSMDFNGLKSRFLGEAIRRKNSQERDNGETSAFFGKMSIKGRGRGNYGNPRGNHSRGGFSARPTYSTSQTLQCEICKKMGHTKQSCWSNRTGQSRPFRAKPRPNSQTTAMFSETRHGTDHRREKKPYVNQGLLHTESKHFEALTAYGYQEGDEDMWILDSGASQSMANKREMFVEYANFDRAQDVKVGGKQILKAYGYGKIIMQAQNAESQTFCCLENVLFVPRLRKCLLSMSRALDSKWEVKCAADKITLSKGSVQLIATRVGNLFCIMQGHQLTPSNANNLEACNSDAPSDNNDPGPTPENKCLILAAEPTSNGASQETTVTKANDPEKTNVASDANNDIPSLQEFHQTLAHIGKHKVEAFLRRENIKFTKTDDGPCTTCIENKQRSVTYRSKPESSIPMELGHLCTDLVNPGHTSIAGNRYAMFITDRYSKFRRAYYLRHKDEAVTKL